MLACKRGRAQQPHQSGYGLQSSLPGACWAWQRCSGKRLSSDCHCQQQPGTDNTDRQAYVCLPASRLASLLLTISLPLCWLLQNLNRPRCICQQDLASARNIAAAQAQAQSATFYSIADCWMTRHRLSGNTVVLKHLQRGLVCDALLRRELVSHLRLSHPHCVRIRHVYCTNSHLASPLLACSAVCVWSFTHTVWRHDTYHIHRERHVDFLWSS